MHCSSRQILLLAALLKAHHRWAYSSGTQQASDHWLVTLKISAQCARGCGEYLHAGAVAGDMQPSVAVYLTPEPAHASPHPAVKAHAAGTLGFGFSGGGKPNRATRKLHAAASIVCCFVSPEYPDDQVPQLRCNAWRVT